MAFFNISYQDLDASLVVQPVKISVNDKNTVEKNFIVELDNSDGKGFIELAFSIVEFNKENEQYNRLEVAVPKEELVLENDVYQCRLNIGLETCYGVLIFKNYVDEDGITHEVNREYCFARFEKAHEEMEALKSGAYVKKSYLEEKPAMALVETVVDAKEEERRLRPVIPNSYKKGLTLAPLIIAAICFGSSTLYSVYELILNKRYALAFMGFAPMYGIYGIVYSTMAILFGLAALLIPCFLLKNPLPEVIKKLNKGEINEQQALSAYRKGLILRIIMLIVSLSFTLSFISLALDTAMAMKLINMYFPPVG